MFMLVIIQQVLLYAVSLYNQRVYLVSL